MIWHTWLVYVGLLGGLIAPVFLRTPILHSIGAGVGTALVLVVLWNVAAPPAPCLQNAKGVDILRAYKVCR